MGFENCMSCLFGKLYIEMFLFLFDVLFFFEFVFFIKLKYWYINNDRFVIVSYWFRCVFFIYFYLY